MPNELDDATVSALIAKYGKNLESFEVPYIDATIVMRPPTQAEWRLFRSADVPVEDRLKRLAQSCIVFPGLSALEAAAEDRAALWQTLGNNAAEMASFVVEVKRKKLLPPNGTQT